MTKLLNTHRNAICNHLLAATFRERELRLKQQEHALGLKLLRALYGDDALARMSVLPEGWLPTSQQLFFKHTAGHQTSVNLSDPIRHPARQDYNAVPPPSWSTAWERHGAACQALKEERRQLELEIRGTLAAFTTIEKLADGWPEGYAHFPHPELVPAHLPALRIEDLNARLAAAQEAA